MQPIEVDVIDADEWLSEMERNSKEKRDMRMALVDEWHDEIHDEVSQTDDANDVLELNTHFGLDWMPEDETQ